jgi:RHS repeat-associated protein
VDGLGRPTQTQHTVPGGTAKVDTTYDPIGRVSSVSNPYFSTSDPTYAITQSQYDAFGRVTQTMRPDGSVSRVSYSANCITTTDETGRPRTNCKNVFGKLVEVDEPNAASTGTNATASTVISGSLLTVNSVVDSGTVSLTSGGFTATACYGNSTNSFCVNKPVNSTAAQVTSALASALNAPGSPISATASGATLNLIWNTPGPYYPSVSALATAHDQPGLFTNPSFTSPATMFDHGTGPSLSTNPYVTLYQYDALGNLLCVEQHGDVAPGTPGATGCSSPASSDPTSPWRVRRFTYDSLSRLLTTANPESGTISYFYDTNGNLLQKVSPSPNQTGSAQHTVSYCYDALNRVNGKAYSWQNCQSGQLPQGTAVVSYTYDQGANGVGRLTGLADQAGAASYSHDAIGRISSESRTINSIPNNISKNMSYTYNLDGSINTVTYPSTAVITYAPDSAGRAKSAIDIANSINYVTSATYGPHNALTSFVSGQNAGFNGITNTTVYDVRLQPCRMTASKLGSAPTNCDNSFGELLDLRYKYDLWIGDNGNVTQITNYRDQTRNQAFTYDPLNRLASAQSLGTDCNATVLGGKAKFWGNSYSYDAWGNLLTKIPTKCSAENLNGTVNFRNQLQGGYTYDAAGNMMHDATTNLDYAYDLENRVATAGGFTYIYDADGNRVKKINGTTGTLYWYTTLGIVAESDLAGNLQSEYIFFDGQRVARKDLTGNAVSYYFSDHLKTASVITDSTGNIKAESDYYPWGGELQFINNDSNRYKFTGKERDAESGLDDFGARYYSSPLGRFVTPDPSAMVPRNLAPQELNLYEYAVDSPTRYIDPDGKAPLDSKIITTLSNFYRVVKTEMMPKLAHDYVDKGGMPKNASPELQDGIRGFVMFGADPSYPMSLRYYNYEDAVEGYVAQGITDQVNAWLADPTTTSDDLAAALVTLSGLEHESDAPEAIGFFSEWIGRVDKVLKKAGGSGARNNLVKRLTKAVEDAKKKKEKEEEEAKKKKAEECKKDKTKC